MTKLHIAVGRLARHVLVASVLSLGAVGAAHAVDMDGDSDTGSQLPPNMPTSIPQHWAQDVWDAWQNCWQTCSRDVTSHFTNSAGGRQGTMNYTQHGYCYDYGECRDVFIQGMSDFYSRRQGIPAWPTNADQIRYPD